MAEESVKRTSVDRPREFYKIGRPNMTVGFGSNYQLADEQDWLDKNISPLQELKPYSSININFSTSDGSKYGHGGGDGNIEARMVPYVLKQTEYASAKINDERAKGQAAEKEDAENDVPAELKRPIMYLPLDLKEEKGHTAFDIVSNSGKPDFDKFLKIRRNLQDAVKKAKNAGKDKNVQMNKEQLEAMDIAMLAVFADYNLENGKTLREAAGEATPENFKTVPTKYNGNDQKMVQLACLRKVADEKLFERSISAKQHMSETEASGEIPIEIYPDVPKTPNLRRVGNDWVGIDKDGYTPCYRLSIKCYPTHKYPYVITLKTMKGHPLGWDANKHQMTGSDQNVGIEERTAIDVKTFTISASKAEWDCVTDCISTIHHGTMSLGYPKAYEMSQKFIQMNYEAYHNAKKN